MDTSFDLRLHAAKHNRFEIVVAHYNEDLSWLKPAAAEAIIYVKGNPPKEGRLCRDMIKLPNVGRESHTFLKHIVSRYDTLADVTLFLQGSRDGKGCRRAHTALTITQMKEKALKTRVGELTTFGSEEGTLRPYYRWETSEWKADPDYLFWMEQSKIELLHSDRSPGQFWFDIFGYDHPPDIVFAEGAMFAVRAESIRSRPREFYQELLDRFEDPPHINPEIGHYVEKFWAEILSCTLLSPATAN